MKQENKDSKANNKKDYITRLIIMQTVICCIIFLMVFILQKTNDRMFDEIQLKFLTAMSSGITKDDAVQTFRKISNYISMPMDELTKEDNNLKETIAHEDENMTENISETTETLGMGGEEINILASKSKASFAKYFISKRITVPVHGKISSRFGYRIHPITEKESFHSGIDISAKEGTRIGAAYYGKISKVSYSDSAGNYIVMDHGNGLKTVYMHCLKVCVEENSVIRAGETIGYVGSTGMSTGPHLHFEIRINDIRYNPSYVLPIENNEV